MTPTQRKNLLKLAEKLESLPPRYKHFAMESFIDTDDELEDEQKARYALHNGGVDQFHCGTTACAVGHGPAAGILFKRSEIDDNRPDWWAYCRRAFGTDGTHSDPLFQWLFDGTWGEYQIDDHHYGAAARIRYYLAGRELPSDFGGKWGADPKPAHKKLYREFDKRYATRT